MFIICNYATGIIILALWIPATSQAAIIAFAVLFGFFSGAYFSLIGALVANISPLQEIGFRTGITFLVASVPALVTSPIAGAIYQHSGSWTGLKVFSGVFCIAATTVVLVTRFYLTGLKLRTVF